jgi:hypothetical protein
MSFKSLSGVIYNFFLSILLIDLDLEKKVLGYTWTRKKKKGRLENVSKDLFNLLALPH